MHVRDSKRKIYVVLFSFCRASSQTPTGALPLDPAGRFPSHTSEPCPQPLTPGDATEFGTIVPRVNTHRLTESVFAGVSGGRPLVLFRLQTILVSLLVNRLIMVDMLGVSNAGELWFDTSSDFLTVKFRDSSRYLVCADLWTEHLSDLVCIHTGCKYVRVILYSEQNIPRPLIRSLLLSCFSHRFH